MEKQSNSGSDAPKSEKTLTSTDGQSPSQETSLLNLVYEEPGVRSYIVDINGELSLHNDLQGPFTRDYIKRIRQLLDCLIVALMDKGLVYIDTWINEDDDVNYNFCEKLGFVDTETLKLVTIGNTLFTFRVMRLYFPTEELIKVLEEVKD